MKYVWPVDKDGNKLSFKTTISQIFTNDGRSMQKIVDDMESSLTKKGNMQ